MDTKVIDHDMLSKIRAVAFGDSLNTFEALKDIFEQRKKCAKLILNCDSLYSSKTVFTEDILEASLDSAKDLFKLCNEEIKRAFYL